MVLLFWAYFESRIRRLLVEGVAKATEELRNLVLQPHHGVGAMMGRLYRKVYGCTYEEDLVGQKRSFLTPSKFQLHDSVD